MSNARDIFGEITPEFMQRLENTFRPLALKGYSRVHTHIHISIGIGQMVPLPSDFAQWDEIDSKMDHVRGV